MVTFTRTLSPPRSPAADVEQYTANMHNQSVSQLLFVQKKRTERRASGRLREAAQQRGIKGSWIGGLDKREINR